MTDATASKRYKRLKIKVPIQLTDPNGKIFAGISNDISASGFSAFLRCREDFVIDELADNAFVMHNFARLERLFIDTQFRSVFNLDLDLPPQQAMVTRVENSWLRGFEVFIAARFSGLAEDAREHINTYVDNNTDVHAPEDLVDDRAGLLAELDTARGDTIKLEFPSRHLYIPVVRDLCERLARQAGFSEMDCFKIKVTADEVFSNAFRHGSPEYGDNVIDVLINIDRKGLFVRVRDQGGVPFNFKRFRESDSDIPSDDRSGLHLVDKFVDGWVVNIKPGEYTEVSFIKNREEGSQS